MPMPASSRQYCIAWYGNPLWCLRREKRSSSAAATISPSFMIVAAESPSVVKPTMYIMNGQLYTKFLRNAVRTITPKALACLDHNNAEGVG